MNHISQELLDFLEQLAANNNTDRMHAHKTEYQQVRADFIKFAEQLNQWLAIHDSDLIDTEVKKWVFRINRDIRFSKNKLPYKENMGVSLVREWKKSPYAWYYLHIQPGNHSFIAAGWYMPPSSILKVIRATIAEKHKEYESLITKKNVSQHFHYLLWDPVKTTPQWFTKDHPAIEHLRKKRFIRQEELSDTQIVSPKFLSTCVDHLQHLTPIIKFFNSAVEQWIKTWAINPNKLC